MQLGVKSIFSMKDKLLWKDNVEANARYSRWGCLEITGIPSSASDKDLDELCVRRLAKLELILTQMTLRTATVLETKAKP